MSSNFKTWIFTASFIGVSLFVFVQTRDRDVPKDQYSLNQNFTHKDGSISNTSRETQLPGKFRATKIHDGDTCEVIGADGIKITIRFAGIDAPELAQDFGHDAREILRQLIEDRTVTLAELKRDKYGRHLAQVYCDGQWINREMIAKGAAWAYLAGPHFDEFKRMEEGAKSKHAGLWASDNPKPPWETRK